MASSSNFDEAAESTRLHDFVCALQTWWKLARIDRDRLPWRSTRDPWRVLVSEMMLGQTQVDRVVPKYVAFIERFSTPKSCVKATVGEILQMWVGLGYNRRALALHAAATAITHDFGGVVPRNLDQLLRLPGVGPYTARAVLSFAYEEDVAVVDTNIGRVLARAIAGKSLSTKDVQRLAETLVPADQSRSWNLAMMDFGAAVCTSRNPKCATCPIFAANCCAWQSRSDAVDPAINSAGVSKKQAVFVGSDREGRGRLIRAACDGAIRRSDISKVAGWPDDRDRVNRVVSALLREGLLVETTSGGLQLP